MPRKKKAPRSKKQTDIRSFFTPDSVVVEKNPVPGLKKRAFDTQDTPSVLSYFKRKDERRRQAAIQEIKSQQTLAPQAAIALTYRDDGDGVGAVYDHASIQNTTKRPTGILNLTVITKHLKAAIEDYHVLKFGEALDDTQHRYPPLLDNVSSTFGLLVLPGVSVKRFNSVEYEKRVEVEMEHIRKARLQGRPILAICGGSWVLYKQFGGEIIEVQEHAYRAGMPRLSTNSGKVTNNKQIHRISIAPGANLLRSAMDLRLQSNEQPTVNSVHSYAPDKKTLPAGLMISASCVQDDEIAPINANPKNISKEKLKPEADSVEAFESIHGAPVLGVQWHPEAYSSRKAENFGAQNQEHLIDYMAKAGQTFMNKQRFLSTFPMQYADQIKKLNTTELLARNHRVLRRCTQNRVSFFAPKLNTSENELRHVREVVNEIKAKENYYEEKTGLKNKQSSSSLVSASSSSLIPRT